jgi:hypothetical protein
VSPSVGLCPDRRLLSLDPSAILDGVTLHPSVARALATCACGATLLLGACGGPVATVTPSSSTSPASSPGSTRAFSASGFSTVIPSGWSDETANQSAVAAASGSGPVLMLLVAPDGGHIDARTAPQPIPDDQLAQYLQSVSQHGATGVSQPVPVDIDGVSGVVITYTLTSSSGVSSKNEDMVVNQGGNTYDIVLNTAVAAFTQDSAALQTVLNSWRWR